MRRKPRPRACSGRILFAARERAQRDDHADVSDVPALTKHEHADDASDRAVGSVHVPCSTASQIEVVLGDLTRAGGMDDEQPVAGEVWKLAQIVACLVGSERVLAHHEEDRPLPRR